MRKLLIFTFLLALTVLGTSISQAFAGYAHYLVDANSGKVLSASHANDSNHPASLTKMMTLYLTFEALHNGRLNWNSRIRMTRRAAAVIPFKLGVKAGNTFTVREGVEGMIVLSANDAAEAMCDHFAGKGKSCGEVLTAKARKLGMLHTRFVNGSGLHDPRQVTTARDMATLGLALMRDFPREYKLFSKTSFVFRGKRLRGHNHLMARYRGMDGIKTGYIRASGFNIVTAVKRGNKRIVGVVMGGKTAKRRDDQMATLLDAAMPNASNRHHATARVGDIPLPKSRPNRPAQTAIAIVTASDIPLPLPRPKSGAAQAQSEPVATAALDNIWEIQIAAVSDEKAALNLLNKAQSAVSGNLVQARPYTKRIARGDAALYRARFAGFTSRSEASTACQALKTRSYQCLVVSGGESG